MSKPTPPKGNVAAAGLLQRRVAEVIQRKNVEKKLAAGQKLILKFGRDPTSDTLHLGHAVPLRKLREFQLAGHRVVIVIGTFTGLVGDPSGHTLGREMVDLKKVSQNIKNLESVFAKILDPKKTIFTYNADWLAKLTLKDLVELASTITVQQNIERDLFQERLRNSRPIGLHEFLYPIMQGYDSVALAKRGLTPDLEVGSTDQTFNLLIGRKLMISSGLQGQDILTTPMLEGTDGRKMSSSWGNTINITDTPFNMFGKLMGVRDELIVKYLDLTTDLRPTEIDNITTQLQLRSITPLEAKKVLAREVVTLYHGSSAASNAQKEFEEVIQAKGVPTERGQFNLNGTGAINVVDLLVESDMVRSRGEARRVIIQGGVDLIEATAAGEILTRLTISNLTQLVTPKTDQKILTIMQLGKRKAVEVKP